MKNLTQEQKILADKVDYIIDNYTNGVADICNKFGIDFENTVRRWRNKVGQTSSITGAYQEAFEKHFNIPLKIWQKNIPFNPEKLKQIIEEERIQQKKTKGNSSQLTLKSGKEKLIGRTTELHTIEKKLEKYGVVLIHGIGGIGKSALVSHYLHKQKNYFDYYGFFEGLDSFIIELKTSLKLESEKTEELFREALTKLRTLEGSKLFVIDGIRDIEENRHRLETLSELKKHGYQILLSSREKSEEIESFQIDKLNNHDAYNLFNSIHHFDDEILIHKLLSYLDYHPFFIEKLAKTFQSKKTLNPSKIKEKFDNGEFSQISIKRRETFHNHLNKLFSFDNLDSEEILVLKQLSTLPSIWIDTKALSKIFMVQNCEEFEEILNYLVEKGWLSLEKNHYKLHQIVKEYIWDFHLPKFNEVEHIIDFFKKITVENTNHHVAIKNQKWILYFLSLYILLQKINLFNEKTSTLFTQIGNILYLLSPLKSKPFYLKALEINQKLFGEKHINTATSYHNMALLYEENKEYQQAEQYYLKSLEIHQNIYGEKSLKTAIVCNNLANLYMIQREYKKAEKFYLKSLYITEELLGWKHPSTAISYNNLAELYQTIGLYQKAYKLYQKDLNINLELLGEKHPDTAESYHNLAGFYWIQKKEKKAEKYYLKSSKIKEETLGKKHLSTIKTFNNLAVFYSSIQKFKEAYQIMQEVEHSYKQLLPESHPSLIQSQKNLVIIKKLMGKI
jgi:tetratricopeptide (TPR) repeat protein